MVDKGKPEAGKIYSLTGGHGTPSIASGNTWAESEVKEYKKRKLPFDCEVLEQPEEITNKFSGEKVMLPPDAVAVYDCIKGAEMLGEQTMVRKGIDWFI